MTEKNLSDLLSDYMKKNYEFAITEYDSENSYAKNNRLWKHVSHYFWISICRGWMGWKTAMRGLKKNILNFLLCQLVTHVRISRTGWI